MTHLSLSRRPRSANPNSQGEFQRTPLWRACFLGKADVVQPLLEAGADPRIGNEQVGCLHDSEGLRCRRWAGFGWGLW